jgi:hypothetical protein
VAGHNGVFLHVVPWCWLGVVCATTKYVLYLSLLVEDYTCGFFCPTPGLSLSAVLSHIVPLSGVASVCLPSPMALRTVGSRNYRRVGRFPHTGNTSMMLVDCRPLAAVVVKMLNLMLLVQNFLCLANSEKNVQFTSKLHIRITHCTQTTQQYRHMETINPITYTTYKFK